MPLNFIHLEQFVASVKNLDPVVRILSRYS